MKIIELTCMTDNNGNLRIPMHTMLEMGIRPESQVKLAYLSGSDKANTYSEFMVTPDGITAALDEYEQGVNGLVIPIELLDAAGIPADSDISITCGSGEIILRDAELFEPPAGLSELFTDLGILPENITVSYEGEKKNEQE